jgi:ABC-type multidrug transport system fused ATPase/permease subunit
MSVPLLTTTVSLAVYTAVMGNRLTASTAFPALSLLNSLREPMQSLPEVLMSLLVEGRTSLERMNAFMNEEDIPEYVEKGSGGSTDEQCVEVRGGSFRWAPGNKSIWDQSDRYKARPGYIQGIAELCGCRKRKKWEVEAVETDQDRGLCLQDIDFELHHGRLCCIIGKVGSGKTSLMHALLGELDKTKGSVAVKGSVAYAAQSSFVMNMTLKDNILFGSDYDEEKYKQVLFACALEEDLKQLPAGARVIQHYVEVMSTATTT